MAKPYGGHVTIRLAAAVVTFAVAAFPAAAIADDEPAPAASDPVPAAGEPATVSCLTKAGTVDGLSIRGVRVGARARITDPDGKPLAVNSVSYCVEGGGDFSFALDRQSDVVLVLSTSESDSIGPINPTSPAQSARAEFPDMKRMLRSGSTSAYRVDARRQLLLGIAAGRVNFVAAADRLLLEYPGRLGYYMRRLGF
jgi:hypothetical protein